MLKLKDLYEKYKNWVVAILLILFLFKSCQNSMNKRNLAWQTNQYECLVNSSDSTLNTVKLKYEHEIDSLEQRNILLLNELSFERISAEQLKAANNKLWQSNQDLSGSVRDLTKENKNF